MASTPGELRERVWARLMKDRAAAYPLPPHGHHPNFRGAGEAAERMTAHLLGGLLQAGDAVLSYPDYVLKPLRKRLLEAGVTVVVPARYGGAYRRLEPGRVDPARGSSIAGAEREGEKITILPVVRFACLACVALGPHGEVLDKGYGFSLPPELSSLPKLTLVHPLQLLEDSFDTALHVGIWATPAKVMNLSS